MYGVGRYSSQGASRMPNMLHFGVYFSAFPFAAFPCLPLFIACLSPTISPPFHPSALPLFIACLSPTLSPPFHPSPLLKEANKKLSYRRQNAVSIIKSSEPRHTMSDGNVAVERGRGEGCCRWFWLSAPRMVVGMHLADAFVRTGQECWRTILI